MLQKRVREYKEQNVVHRQMTRVFNAATFWVIKAVLARIFRTYKSQGAISIQGRFVLLKEHHSGVVCKLERLSSNVEIVYDRVVLLHNIVNKKDEFETRNA